MMCYAFLENNGSGNVRGKATVESAFSFEKLTPDESIHLVEENQDNLLVSAGLKKRFAGKRYLVLISIKDFQETEPLNIDRSGFKNMED